MAQTSSGGFFFPLQKFWCGEGIFPRVHLGIFRSVYGGNLQNFLSLSIQTLGTQVPDCPLLPHSAHSSRLWALILELSSLHPNL